MAVPVPVAGPVTRWRRASLGSWHCPAGGPGDSPEILIDGWGIAMAARLPDGKVLVAATIRRDSFSLSTWLRRRGPRRLLRVKVSCAANDWGAPCNIVVLPWVSSAIRVPWKMIAALPIWFYRRRRCVSIVHRLNC